MPGPTGRFERRASRRGAERKEAELFSQLQLRLVARPGPSSCYANNMSKKTCRICSTAGMSALLLSVGLSLSSLFCPITLLLSKKKNVFNLISGVTWGAM